MANAMINLYNKPSIKQAYLVEHRGTSETLKALVKAYASKRIVYITKDVMIVKHSHTVFKTHRNYSSSPEKREYICTPSLIKKELKLRNTSNRDNEEMLTLGSRKIDQMMAEIPGMEGQEKWGSIFLCVTKTSRPDQGPPSPIDEKFVYTADRNCQFYISIDGQRVVDLSRQKPSKADTVIPFSTEQTKVPMYCAISLIDRGDGTVIKKPINKYGLMELNITTKSGRKQTFMIKESTMPEDHNCLCTVSIHNMRLFLGYQHNPEVAMLTYITATKKNSKQRKQRATEEEEEEEKNKEEVSSERPKKAFQEPQTLTDSEDDAQENLDKKMKKTPTVVLVKGEESSDTDDEEDMETVPALTLKKGKKRPRDFEEGDSDDKGAIDEAPTDNKHVKEVKNSINSKKDKRKRTHKEKDNKNEVVEERQKNADERKRRLEAMFPSMPNAVSSLFFLPKVPDNDDEMNI